MKEVMKGKGLDSVPVKGSLRSGLEVSERVRGREEEKVLGQAKGI